VGEDAAADIEALSQRVRPIAIITRESPGTRVIVLGAEVQFEMRNNVLLLSKFLRPEQAC
jgi:hypothetical protein